MSVDNEIYNQHAGTWWSEDGVLHFLKTAVQPARFGYFERILTQVLQLPPQGKNLLDVGCGGGILAEDFARLGCQVTGVDPSAPSLDAARQHAEQEGLQITYQQSGGESLSFGDATFDIVCCCDVLEHVDDVSEVIAEISRVLRPGGVFFYDTINRTVRSKLIAIKLLQEWGWSSFMPPDLHDWSQFIKPEELAAILEEKGFRPRQMVGMVPERHPLRLLKALRDRKKRKITIGQLGTLLRSREGKDLSVSYMGYAVK